MDFDQLRRYRDYELELVLPALPAGASILEIGAGAGWQARALAERGFDVQAVDVDVAGAGYREIRVWPVTLYDGVRLPFPDACFDVVYSSNVLEHIPQVERFQHEIRRVLKPDGLAVHVVPTGVWRFWTNLTYYPVLARRYLRKYLLGAGSSEQPGGDRDSGGQPGPAHATEDGLLAKLARVAVPSRHGEEGNCLTEVVQFSRPRWDALFRTTGWRVQMCAPSRLFYSGYFLLGPALSLRARQVLSYGLGSACLVYVLGR